MNIESLADTVSIAAKLGNIAGSALEDGKISLRDVVLLPNLAMVFVQLIKTDWSQLLPEIKDLADDEKQFLISRFNEEFSIPQSGMETTIEMVAGVIFQLAGVLRNLAGLVKK